MEYDDIKLLSDPKLTNDKVDSPFLNGTTIICLYPVQIPSEKRTYKDGK
jgi:hypothetical protein